MKLFQFLGLAAVLVHVNALAPTDEPRDCDPPQSGYLPNHNIAPSLLANYTKKWTMKYNVNEQFYATPLVYTPKGSTQELVITVSIQNIVRVIDGLTGALVMSRALDAPYLSSDSNCNDGKTVGITGTPIIDTDSEILYFFTKGYFNGLAGPQGVSNGSYKMWALNLPSLTIIPQFPVLIQGPASNDPSRYFIGGEILQRPGLAMIGNSIIAGFGGHCDSMNYTGILLSVSKTPGAGVVDMMAMEAAPGLPADLNLLAGKGGKAGIWQSGMGIAADTTKNRVFFVTGNGDGPGANNGPNGPPASGKIPVSTLEQAIVNIGVDPVTGLFTQQDYFSPINYQKLNAGDKDMSSSGLTLLDPVTFSGGGVNRVAVAGSKAGVVYVVDADNLGGFKMGPGNTDAVLQEMTFTGAHFYSGIGSYPLEGGFIYLCTTGGHLQAWKLTPDAQGRPNFAFAAQTSITLGCRGTPTITSQNGAPGTAIVWMHDSTHGLVAFNAVPSGTTLTQITIPGSGGLGKFHRPAFGNNHVYVTSSNKIIAIGGAAQ
ncbi:uncharacterized protein PAC_10457 [Phialocephala subalpina]|uniref:Glyoxal oxidase n=1 Tax=Phialocephala subalpina TaxID=576137 RepID=A0A1L7X6B7_9HELO|nr:uncharacterized protein PAC_10457 [Phialocephala subalpina]